MKLEQLDNEVKIWDLESDIAVCIFRAWNALQYLTINHNQLSEQSVWDLRDEIKNCLERLDLVTKDPNLMTEDEHAMLTIGYQTDQIPEQDKAFYLRKYKELNRAWEEYLSE